MASAFSTSRRRSADARASGDSTLCASFIRRMRLGLDLGAHARSPCALILSASASASACARIAAPRSALAAFSACAALVRRSASRSAACAAPISSIAFLRSAISTSRAVNTFSSADTACGARDVGRGLRLALRLALARHRDGALLLGQLQRLAALDLGGLDRALLLDALLLDRLLGADARRLDRLLGGDLRALGVLLALRALGGHLGALARARDLDLALLRQARVFALAVDVAATASRPRGSCCGSRSACPARRRCAASCGARSARSAASGPRRRTRCSG